MRWFLLLCCSFFLTPPAWSSSDSEALSRHLLSKTGIQDLLQHYPLLVEQGVMLRMADLSAPPEMEASFRDIVARSFQAEDLARSVEQALSRAFSAQELSQLLAWYNSELGQRIVGAELSDVTGEEYLVLQQDLDRLVVKYRGSERERLFAAYDRATFATRMMVDNATSVQLGMVATLSSVLNGPDLPDYAQLRQIIESRRDGMRGQVGQQVYLNYLYTYQELSVEDLQGYIQFARSELGERFFRVLATSVYQVLSEHSAMVSRRPGVGRDRSIDAPNQPGA